MSDAIAYKKKVLFPHLDFVNFMLNKSLGTKFEPLWKHVHNCITNDKKKMTSYEISKIQRTVVTNKKRFKTWNKKKSRESQTYQPIPHHIRGYNNQNKRYTERNSRDLRLSTLKRERTNDFRHRNSSRSPQPRRQGNGLSSYSRNISPRQVIDSTRRGHTEDSSSFSREREHSLKYNNRHRDFPENERFQRRTVSFSPPEEDQGSYQRDNSNFKHKNVHLSPHSSRHHEHTRSPKDEEHKSNQGYHSKDLPRLIKNYERNPKSQHDEYYQGTSVVHSHRLSVHERLGAPPNRTDRNESFTSQKRNSNLNMSPSTKVTSEQHSKLKRSIDQKTIREEEQTNSEEFNPRFEEPKENRLKISCEELLETISSESEKSEKVIKSFINTDEKVGEKKSEEIVRKDEKEKQSKEVVVKDIKEVESEDVIQKKAVEEEKSDTFVNLKKIDISLDNEIEELDDDEKKKSMFDGKFLKKVVEDQAENSSSRRDIELSKTISFENNSSTDKKSTSSKFQSKVQVDEENEDINSMPEKSTTPKLMEFDFLNTSINVDKEGIAHSDGSRSCILHKSDKLIDFEVSEEDMKKHKLKPFTVVIHELNLTYITEGETSVLIDEELLAMNPHLEEVLSPYMNEANDDATRDDLDLSLGVEQSPKETIQKLNSEPSSKRRVVVNSSPSAESQVSKGLKKKKRVFDKDFH